MYLYIKALHIIFIVTWFSGMFYLVRLFIYNREANEKPEPDKTILQQQFSIMIKRLWTGIAWPSAVLTLVFGSWLLYLYPAMSTWLWIKLGFVSGFIFITSLYTLFTSNKKIIFLNGHRSNSVSGMRWPPYSWCVLSCWLW